ncbi:MAG: carboxy terminal-processing peptidase, partial [Gammaproteobacteria bacterium]|nr:carboxy terminal-processing peptidase [Gammaproteobacteria bacterium]
MTRRIFGSRTATGVALAAFATTAVADTGIRPDDWEGLQPLPSHRQTSVDIVDRLRDGHFVKKGLDDEVSSQTFDNYLDFLDPRRLHFLADDIAEFENHRHHLDDALNEGDVEPAFAIYNRYRRRALERIEYEALLIEQGVEQFDFTLDESIDVDRSDAPWPESREALENLWRLDIKSRALSGKLAGESSEAIGEALAKRGQNRARTIRQTRSEDVFQRFVNAFALTYDEHTQYFSPRDSEDFGIFMSLSLQGIGAVLGTEDEYTVVRSLVKGGPADKGGELQPGDRIVAVGQNRQPFVDIIGRRSDDVVQLIRGPKGSRVRLKVIPTGAKEEDYRVVEIVRESVSLVDQSASKSLLTISRDGREHRIGVVVVPTFYADFRAMELGDRSYKSTTRDVAKLIEEMKAEDIDGLIVDLRDNGGGSLQEAVELTGLFVDSGPVVQVKSLRGSTRVLGDDDGAAVWDGPLAVMVNGGSASASEIFAGAIQDYDLGVVVGSPTFGKGTVQTLVELPRGRGQLKVTERKFYRVSGSSTHYNGIIPDIEYPAPIDLLHRDRWDGGAIGGRGSDVSPIGHPSAQRFSAHVGALHRRHEERVADDPEFAYLRARGEYLKGLQARTQVSLSEETRLAEKAADDAQALRLENELLVAKGKEPVASLEE